MKLKRIVIQAKDIQIITGKHIRACYRSLAAVKDSLGKQKYQEVSIKEYCDYTGLKQDEVESIIL